MGSVSLGFNKLDSDVIAYDFVAHRNRKEYVRQLLDETGGAIVLTPSNEMGESLGIVRVVKNDSGNAALLRIIILNPSYTKDAQSWMSFLMPDIIETVIRPLGVARVYTNLHPAMTEAIEGYSAMGFSRLAELDCWQAGGMTFVSMFLDL